MDWAGNFVTIVNGVGFPIVVCVFLVWYIYKENKRRMEEKEEYENKQNDLYLKLSQSVDNNTAALNKLIMRMEDKK
jgi:hypothetical protein